MRSQPKEFRCDPTSTTDAGGPPDPSLFADHDPGVPALARGVRPAFRDLARAAPCRTHSPVPVVSDQREKGVAVHGRAVGLRTAVPLYPHTSPEDPDRTHSFSPSREETAADLEPRGSEGSAGDGR